MLSISNVKGVQAAAYYEKDGYYARAENDSDKWQGKLTKQLSLSENLNPKEFNHLVLENPKRAGFDLCFSAPKSVSIAMTLDEKTKKDMLSAHNKAVEQILSEIEKNEIAARVTQNSETISIKTGNMAVGKFNHYVSRNSDPQLHTHCVVLNKTSYNNKIYAIDNTDLYKNKILYGQLYRNELAKNLQAIGYKTEMTDNEKGFFELKGIEKYTLEQFSSRRAEIIEQMKAWGASLDNALTASKATLLTRQAKQHKDLNELTKSWRETINEMGGVEVNKSEESIRTMPNAHKDAFIRAVTRLENEKFAFTERELERASLAEGVTAGMKRTDFKQELEKSSLIRLGEIKKSDGNIYYTTSENIATEQAITQNVHNTCNQMFSVNWQKAKNDLMKLSSQKNLTLSDEQQKAILHISCNKDQYSAVQGLAGTGKTYMLNAAREILENNGYAVRGVAFTGKAAEGLEADAKIKSSTIHSFLNKLEKEAGNKVEGENLTVKKEWNLEGLKSSKIPEIWIVDEASMLDNKIMLQVQKAAELKNAKVTFVGDSQQLQPVGVGNAYSNLVQNENISMCFLSDIRRQKNENLLAAVKESVQGDIYKSLELVSDSTTEIKSVAKRFTAITKEYINLTAKERESTIVLTASNKDRISLNDKIRTELVRSGVLQDGQAFKVQSGKIEVTHNFLVGEKIMFFQNNHKIGVKNGQVGKIAKIDGDNLTVESGGKNIKLNVNKYNYFDHGYTMTTHKAQGITVDRAIINIDSSQKQMNSRNAFYVDISRARHKVNIFTDSKENISNQVSEFTKKITSDSFLIETFKAPKIEKTSVSMQLPSFLGVLNVPLRKSQITVKNAVKKISQGLKNSHEIKLNRNKGIHF